MSSRGFEMLKNEINVLKVNDADPKHWGKKLAFWTELYLVTQVPTVWIGTCELMKFISKLFFSLLKLFVINTDILAVWYIIIHGFGYRTWCTVPPPCNMISALVVPNCSKLFLWHLYFKESMTDFQLLVFSHISFPMALNPLFGAILNF